jgi:hypothetical protein
VERPMTDDPLAVAAAKKLIGDLADSIESMFDEVSEEISGVVSKETLRRLLIEDLQRKGIKHDA